MTTKIKVENLEVSGHSIDISVQYMSTKSEYVTRLKPGASQEFYVWGANQLLLTEVSADEISGVEAKG